MRTAFIKKLVELADTDPDIFLLIGDYGYSVVEPFKEKFPSRFINVGISEQNMIGVAAGLALTRKKVFVYSIVPFVTMRCFEQIRIDLCYQNLPVRVVGIGAGLAFGAAAATHHSIEDLALMCSLPNMTVVSPANTADIQALLPQLNLLTGPAYLRLGRGLPSKPAIKTSIESGISHKGTCGAETSYQSHLSTDIKIGHPTQVIPSNKNLFLATGEMLSVATQVVQKLQTHGIDCGLVNIHTIKPLNLDFIASMANSLNAIFTLEEHTAVGGLGQQVASFLCQNCSKKILFKAFTLPDEYCHQIGSRDYLLDQAGLGMENIYTQTAKILDIQLKNNWDTKHQIKV